MKEAFEFINTIGFPIFVAIWMLVKDQKEKEQTRDALIKLTEAISKLTEKQG